MKNVSGENQFKLFKLCLAMTVLAVGVSAGAQQPPNGSQSSQVDAQLGSARLNQSPATSQEFKDKLMRDLGLSEANGLKLKTRSDSTGWDEAFGAPKSGRMRALPRSDQNREDFGSKTEGVHSGGGNIGEDGQLTEFVLGRAIKPLEIRKQDFYKNEFEQIVQTIQKEVPEFRDFITQGIFFKNWSLSSKPIIAEECLNQVQVDIGKIYIVACQDTVEVTIYQPWWESASGLDRTKLVMHELLLFHGIQMMSPAGSSQWRFNQSNFVSGTIVRTKSEIIKSVFDLNKMIFEFKSGDGRKLIQAFGKRGFAYLLSQEFGKYLFEIKKVTLDASCHPSKETKDISFASSLPQIYRCNITNGYDLSDTKSPTRSQQYQEAICNTFMETAWTSLSWASINAYENLAPRYDQTQLIATSAFFLSEHLFYKNLTLEEAQQVSTLACADLADLAGKKRWEVFVTNEVSDRFLSWYNNVYLQRGSKDE